MEPEPELTIKAPLLQGHDDGKHMMIRGEDGEMREVEIVATRDKLSAYQEACPILPLPMAVVCGVLNIIPGEFSNQQWFITID